MQDYDTILEAAEDEFVEKRSRFICAIAPVTTPEEAMAFISARREEHYDARHTVYAYILKDGVCRYSDDGEPQGTGGQPALEVLKRSGLVDVCVAVTRYFGGILLGAGGLVRAYSHSAVLAINEAEVVVYEPYCEYCLVCGYSEYQKYSNILGIEKAVIDSTDFGAEVTVRFAVKKTQAERILAKISESGFGRDVPQLCGERFDCR